MCCVFNTMYTHTIHEDNGLPAAARPDQVLPGAVSVALEEGSVLPCARACGSAARRDPALSRQEAAPGLRDLASCLLPKTHAKGQRLFCEL